MRNIYFILFLTINSSLYSQQASTLVVHDTRSTNDLPSTYHNEVKAEFKLKGVVGIPGENTYSGMLTIAPWSDDSGGKIHQMNFNANGIFYRNAFQSSNWGIWNKMIMQDPTGTLYLEGPSSSENGKLTLVNTQNAINAGNSINFTSFGTAGPGPQIRSGLEMANGTASKMYLTLGSYYDTGKEELTLKNGKVGINKREPVSTLNVFVPSSSDFIDAMTIDVESFGTGENLNRSNFFRVRDVGSGDANVPIIIKGNGNVGIGVNPTHKLDVNGTIHTKEIKVDLIGWADFVFKNDYQLPTLESVEKHIIEKGHLPSVPSELDVMKNGLLIGENQKLLLQKIEELTLYSIEQNKQIKSLLERVEKLEAQKTNQP